MNRRYIKVGMFFLTCLAQAEDTPKKEKIIYTVARKVEQSFDQYVVAKADAKKEFYAVLEYGYKHKEIRKISVKDRNEYDDTSYRIDKITDHLISEQMFNSSDVNDLVKYVGCFHQPIVRPFGRIAFPVARIMIAIGEPSSVACFEALKNENNLTLLEIDLLCMIINEVNCSNFNERFDQLGANHPAVVEKILKRKEK